MSNKRNVPKVSVCVPVYNAEKYLKDCLDSLFRQTLKEIEIICVDDGSTDESAKILDDYAKRNKNMKVIHQKNTGLGGARDTGVKNAVGEYIGFVDADDVVDERMYEELYELAVNNKVETVFCNLDLFPKDVKTNKKIWYNAYTGEVTPEFLYRNTQPWNKIFARRLLERTRARFGKNDSICMLLMVKSRGVFSTDEIMYHYRVGHDSMSNKFNIKEFEDTVEAVVKIRNEVIKDSRLKSEMKEYFDFVVINSIVKVLTVAVLLNDKVIYDEYRKKLKKCNYTRNSFCKKNLKTEHGVLKFFAIMHILPRSYVLSRFLICFAMGGRVR